jgi:hypothetical protein
VPGEARFGPHQCVEGTVGEGIARAQLAHLPGT